MTKKIDGFIGAGDGVFAESFCCEFEVDGTDLCAILLDVKLPDGSEESRRYVPERTCKRIFIEGWLWKCSECGSRHDSGHLYNYCPDCGAKVVDR